ncbi:XrtA/PEP-CTERM system histidine kinase PrsK [Sphingomonas sp. G-3-2-10]|uniref:XrtA/PEP-CTERM system histidine kinase PrsK n=1 Tax=Sphingomonas sp. G-3-2-10 TaxID=2728838 RepID=UPI00146D5740|nr:XrtA/PEP-CTERM system histidine kinase PrsK [Sphingomonas sp. G-3-2-10]NML06945.1 PEP-CTERM system histidine kinase PrsK [Sphingomonas sp. G-3-2-10]
MAAVLSLWTHALAALLFGALALWAWQRKEGGIPRRPLAFALAATALWALSVAGIGGAETGTRFAELLRNLSWLAFMIVLHRRDGNVRPPVALGTVYGVVALVSVVSVVLYIIGTGDSEAAAEFLTASLLLRMLVTVAALVLVRALHQAVAAQASTGLRWIVLALAAMWFIDFNLVSAVYLTASWPAQLVAMRGFGMIIVAAAMAAGLQRKDDWNVVVSRTVAYQSLSLVAILAYFALLALATSAIATVGGANARVLQTAFVFGSTAAMLTLVSSSWLRAWTKVKLAKHFFRHRYDYRAEWMRFTDTLGTPAGAAPLDERIVKAIADLVESPGGTLLVPEGQGLGHGATWNWDSDATGPADAALARHLANSGRILELDMLRKADSVETALLPQWTLDRTDAWVLVPLPHLGSLAGAILLARPPLDRPLDWEDFDLLKVAGRQVASYLAESRAQEALADAQRFDEFNRRFAFILHDIKNLVSQLTLTARNAERHADKPEFRADMVETLRDSAEKMTALLARLSQHGPRRAEPLQSVEILPLVERIAATNRARHPVVVSGHPAIALADPAALEQMLAHLVQNAIDASPASEPVTIAVAADNAAVAIDVIDNGVGMSPGFVRDKLFKPFVSSKSGGFGIGAFEARQLATQMDGRIDVTSREGSGSRFRVTLRPAMAPVTEHAA